MLTTLPPSCAVVMKSGNLNFLEPSGPLQASNVTALPLPLLHNIYRDADKSLARYWKETSYSDQRLTKLYQDLWRTNNNNIFLLFVEMDGTEIEFR